MNETRFCIKMKKQNVSFKLQQVFFYLNNINMLFLRQITSKKKRQIFCRRQNIKIDFNKSFTATLNATLSACEPISMVWRLLQWWGKE